MNSLHGCSVVIGARTKQVARDQYFVLGASRQGTARDFGLLDMAYACIQGAHLAGKNALFNGDMPLEDVARQLSGKILNQTAPILTAPSFYRQVEDVAAEVKKYTNRNPLDLVYAGPVFPQEQNDYFSGKLVDTAAHSMQAVAPAIQKKFEEAAGGVANTLSTIKWVAIGGAIAVVVALATGIGFGVHARLKG